MGLAKIRGHAGLLQGAYLYFIKSEGLYREVGAASFVDWAMQQQRWPGKSFSQQAAYINKLARCGAVVFELYSWAQRSDYPITQEGAREPHCPEHLEHVHTLQGQHQHHCDGMQMS